MKRITAPVCIVIILMVFSLLLSCSQNGNNETEEFLIDLEPISNGGKPDFGGATFSVWSNILEGDPDALFDYFPGTLELDLVYQRVHEIEEEFNCTIEVKSDGTRRLTGVVPELVSGLYVGDVMFLTSPADPIRAGCLYRLDGLTDYLDYNDTEKYGGYGYLEQGVYNSIPYTVTPVRWIGKQARTGFGLFTVNENIIIRNALTDPREYVEAGTWNWDTFEQIIPDYHINDGSVTTASVNFTWSIYDLAMMNGFEYYTIMSDGVAVPALDSVQSKEVLDYCARLFTQYQDCITFDDQNTMIPKFKNNEIVMTQMAVTHIIRLLSWDVSNYGLVPMPCGPHGTYGEWRTGYSENIAFGIFYNTNEPEAAAVIIDRFCDPLTGYETDEKLEDFLMTTFFDERDVKLIMSMSKNKDIRWEYWPTGGFWDFFNTATSMAKLGRSSTEVIEKYGGESIKTIEEQVIPNIEFIEKYKADHNN